MAVVFVLWLPSMLAINFLMNVASQVFLGALYLYAAEGAAPAPFDAGQMNMAWTGTRRGQGGWHAMSPRRRAWWSDSEASRRLCCRDGVGALPEVALVGTAATPFAEAQTVPPELLIDAR